MGLREYAQVLLAGWRVVVLGILLGMAAAAVFSIATPVRYASETSLYLTAPATPGDTSAAYSGAQLAKEKAIFYVPLLNSSQVDTAIAGRLGPDADPGSVRDAVTTIAAPDTSVVQITTDGASPAEAQQLAVAASDAALALVTEIEASSAPAGQPAVVARVAQAPSLPTAPVTSGPVSNIGLGLVIGLLLGCAVALIRNALDQSVRDTDELTDLTGMAVLGSVGFDKQFDHQPLPVLEGTHAARGESFRQIRTGLGFLSADRPHTVLMIAGPVQREGRTSTACNLAAAFGQAGRSVILVGADLRAPRLESYLGIEAIVGLSTVLARGAQLTDAIQRWERAGVDVLPTGPIPPNPSELLDSPLMQEVLKSLRGSYDVVLVDTPPILPVTDAAVVGALADGTILVVGRGRSTRAEVERAVEILGATGSTMLGTVFTMAPTSSTVTRRLERQPAPEAFPLPALRSPTDDAWTEAGTSTQNRPSPRPRSSSTELPAGEANTR